MTRVCVRARSGGTPAATFTSRRDTRVPVVCRGCLGVLLPERAVVGPRRMSGCPPRERLSIPTARQLRNDTRAPAVVAEEGLPTVVLGTLRELTTCAPCDEPSRDDLALRGSQEFFLPSAFAHVWRHDCNVELASVARASVAREMALLPVCSAEAGHLKAELMFGDGRTIGQHLLMVIDVLWRLRRVCTPASPRNGVPKDDAERSAPPEVERTGEWQWLRGSSCARTFSALRIERPKTTRYARRQGMPAKAAPSAAVCAGHAAAR